MLVPFPFRELDEVEDQVLSLCDKVSKHFFAGEIRPAKEDILTGYKLLLGDVLFNAIGSITARSLALKVFYCFT